MKAGWRDSRVVSKRCITFSVQTKSLKNTVLAIISSVNSFHMLSEDDSSIIIEGDAKYLQNNSKVAPLAERILIKPLNSAELKKLLLFLRDGFEIVFPRPTMLDASLPNINMNKIEMSIESAQKLSMTSNNNDHVLKSLVRSKPWNQLPWSDLFTLYNLSHKGNEHLDPIEFTLKLKSFGFCLKSKNGIVVSSHQIEAVSASCINQDEIISELSSMYWHHLALNEKDTQ